MQKIVTEIPQETTIGRKISVNRLISWNLTRAVLEIGVRGIVLWSQTPYLNRAPYSY